MAFASFDPRQGGAPMAEINMVPLIDVMLVLLVIFIITAPLLTQAVKLELPKASSQVNDLKPEKIDFAIDAQGVLYWNGEKLSRADAAARFRDEAGKPAAAGGSSACRPGRRVSLRRADPGRCVESGADPDRLRERARVAVKPEGDESGAAPSAPGVRADVAPDATSPSTGSGRSRAPARGLSRHRQRGALRRRRRSPDQPSRLALPAQADRARQVDPHQVDSLPPFAPARRRQPVPTPKECMC